MRCPYCGKELLFLYGRFGHEYRRYEVIGFVLDEQIFWEKHPKLKQGVKVYCSGVDCTQPLFTFDTEERSFESLMMEGLL